jgi:hypothetical protein
VQIARIFEKHPAPSEVSRVFSKAPGSRGLRLRVSTRRLRRIRPVFDDLPPDLALVAREAAKSTRPRNPNNDRAAWFQDASTDHPASSCNGILVRNGSASRLLEWRLLWELQSTASRSRQSSTSARGADNGLWILN